MFKFREWFENKDLLDELKDIKYNKQRQAFLLPLEQEASLDQFVIDNEMKSIKRRVE